MVDAFKKLGPLWKLTIVFLIAVAIVTTVNGALKGAAMSEETVEATE